jgi:hypothetical protein
LCGCRSDVCGSSATLGCASFHRIAQTRRF